MPDPERKRKAQDIRACLYASKQTIPEAIVSCPREAADVFLKIVRDKKQANPYYEVGMFLFMNAKNDLLGIRTFEGTVDHSGIYTREVVSAALAFGAVSAIMVHNHPSGHIDPSPQDVAITRKVKSALELIDCRLHDHIVVATAGNNEGAYASIAELGLMPQS